MDDLFSFFLLLVMIRVLFSSSRRSPGRAIVLSPASALAFALASASAAASALAKC